MTVIRTPAGWIVVAMQPRQSDILAGPFETSAAGWRWIDRRTGSPVSKSEERGAYAWDRSIDRKFGGAR